MTPAGTPAPFSVQPIDGLVLFQDFISPEQEADLIHNLDSRPWAGKGVPPNAELRRRTQQYGFLFSYRYRRIEEHTGGLPEFLHPVVSQIQVLPPAPHHEYESKSAPNFLVVNEYEVGQGIMAHTDASLFGETIWVVSLLSSCVISFFRDDRKVDVLLPPRSLLIMSRESRFAWKHEISKQPIDYYDDVPIERSRRVSLTFRSVDVNGVGATTDCRLGADPGSPGPVAGDRQ
ncbi:uncharacterized protein BJ171DRAFT_456187 [Polychytrium aggregatum]|uniref:uncharacterized protein n=1 Tax=Polychytrium aggregatum TaxID=110093 RepID=UPI0022FED2BE|nr:uncharacterized protein BJ171DRAFT_456187 [Polychytrium aggregatum]KAI9207574.1 hypothetical protein BJ171DRAFT_456187 [Polychytrium aggregatum]